MTILEAAAALRAGKISSVELIGESLDRIARMNPRLNAFITVLEDHARARAAERDAELARGIDRGPFHGIPVAHKDLLLTKGVRTTAGSKIFADYFPDHDATVVEKLADAGAVLVGKLGLHELAYGISSTNPHYGAVRNPWNRECIPGGSSGGSGVAVASGMVPLATGSDTGGSIRVPASFCGTVGLKATYGRVSRYGALPLAFTLDHVGPLTQTVRDAAVTLNAIAGYDPHDDSSSRRPVPDYVPSAHANVRGLRVGMPENYYLERLDPEVDTAVRAMFHTAEQLGAHVVPVRVPDIAALNTAAMVILSSEASAALEPHLAHRENFGADVLMRLDQGRLLAATDYVNAQRIRRLLIGDFNALWSHVDCLFTATTPFAAPKIGEDTVTVHSKGGSTVEDVRAATTWYMRGINALGIPALSIPCGFTNSGLPIGLQIVTAAFDEQRLLTIGAALEDATDFHLRHPA
ncbi:MAG TPA: amidase [Bryobacteraceae bacterium]|nr:amidase [Bryobacteraceae bacterium]